jgi:hypothetical protein
MTEKRSRVASYAVCIVLAIPLLLLGWAFVGILGLVGVAVGAAVTAACVVVSRTMQRRVETRRA